MKNKVDFGKMSNVELILIGKLLDLLKVSTFPKRGIILTEQVLRAPDQNVGNLNPWRWMNFDEMHLKVLADNEHIYCNRLNTTTWNKAMRLQLNLCLMGLEL